MAVAFSASLSAQGTDETPASFHDEPKAELAVELIKKYEGLHDSPDYYPYYGYGHCRLEGEKLSYDMTEAEAEELLRKDLEERYRLFRKYKKDALLLTILSYNVGHGTLLGYGKRPKSRLLKKLDVNWDPHCSSIRWHIALCYLNLVVLPEEFMLLHHLEISVQ